MKAKVITNFAAEFGLHVAFNPDFVMENTLNINIYKFIAD